MLVTTHLIYGMATAVVHRVLRPGLHFKKLLPALPQAFPDVLFEVEDLVAEGDKVAFRLIWRATHQGEFFGIPASGARATVMEMHMFRIAHGKAVERWG